MINDVGFRNQMRKVRNEVKNNSKKLFVPYSFESMMLSFGQNMDREEYIKDFKEKNETINAMITKNKCSKNELENLLHKNLQNYVKLIKANDVTEQNLSNPDNKLF